MTSQADATNGATLNDAKALLQSGDLQGAMAAAQKLLADDAGDSDALYILAVCQRYQEKFDDALDTLDRLDAVSPDYGRSFQERGHNLKSLGRPTEALSAYRDAVRMNPSLIASWSAIAESPDAEAEARATATEQVGRLTALPKELLSVRSMTSEGRLLKAERLCRAFLQQNPRHVEGMRLLADLAVRFDVLDDAEFLLESALVFEPDNRFARFDYMNVLYKRQKYAQSLEESRKLLQTDPDNTNYKAAYANQCVATGNYDEALDIYDEVLQKEPDAWLLHLLKGHALKTVGRIDDAVDAYRAGYHSRPDFGDAFWSLANLKTYRFSDEEVTQMQSQQVSATTSTTDRVHLNFALGKHFEDQKDYETAFESYQRGNEYRRQELRYDADRMSEQLMLQREVCDESFFAERSDFGHEAPDPIFIVGLPRAGSTLLEQILASHSQVDGTFELPNIGALAHRLDGRRMRDDAPRYPQRMCEITAKHAADFGQSFIEETRVHRGSAPFFIDKMPNNFRHIGLIRLILPRAKIIDARRHPMACCFSGFKQLFASGQEFTYGLREIGQYYRDYMKLMDHWDDVLPGAVLRVQYEDVVEDLETQVRRLLDFCGLPFEEACIEYHQTERSIRTPSSEQVRQPIYRSGLEQWRHFEPWLDPLKEALGPVLERYPIELQGQD